MDVWRESWQHCKKSYLGVSYLEKQMSRLHSHFANFFFWLNALVSTSQPVYNTVIAATLDADSVSGSPNESMLLYTPVIQGGK